MKKFKFRLEKVLYARNVVKDEKLKLLMLATGELRAQEVKLEHLESEFLRNEVGETVTTIEAIQLAGSYQARLKEEIGFTQVAILDAQKKVEEAMEVYIEASKEAKTLASLKERRKEEHKEAAAKEEREFLDELAVQRAGQRAADEE